MAKTYDEKGRQTRTITERKRLARLGPDFEAERDILDAQNDPGLKKLDNIDKGQDKILDKIFNKKNRKKGKA